MTGGRDPEDSSYKIGLAGCGKMGAAMAKGWREAGIVGTLDILDPAPVSHDLAAFATTDPAHFIARAGDWDMLVLAVKPQIMDEVCASFKKSLPEKLPVLSIAAGQTLASFAPRLGKNQPVIRAMPNTPAAIGKGITVACANDDITRAHKIIANELLSTLGSLVWTEDEAIMDAVTALSGSGPAYLFYLIETMAQAGTDCGLDEDMAMRLARQTVIGAAALAESDPILSPAALRENVTSPNGTTAAALSILMDGKFQEIMSAAIAKAAARSKELST